MKIQISAAFALKVALLYGMGIAACTGTQAQTTDAVSAQPAPQPEIRFRVVHDSIVVVSVMANGSGPFDFILDTGAQNTVVDPVAAKRLSLVMQSEIRQVTLTGTQAVPISAPTTLALGIAKVAGLHVLVQNLDSLRHIDSKIVGILGQDFLGNFNYLVDYHARTIRFDQADMLLNRLAGESVGFEKGRRDMILVADAEGRSGGRTAVRLLLDSGATSLVLIGDGLNRLESLLAGTVLKTAIETSSNGQTSVKTGEVGMLAIGNLQFHDISAAFTSRPTAGVTEDGLLPMAIFRSIYVNNRDSSVVLNPRIQ